MDTNRRTLLLALSMFGLIALWLLLSVARVLPNESERVRAFLPTWFVLANLVFAPCLLGSVGVRGWSAPLLVRLVLLALGLCSYSIASLAYKEHPIAFIAMLAFLLTEAYWIVPKLNERYRHDGTGNR
jgi:thiol:disulfide interchange protein